MSQPAELFETKSDYAYRQVRDRILSGELEPGAVLQQRDLASRIGISTTPLREALRRLKSEGLVELDAHRDARISPLRAEEARDLLELRKSLDPLAAGLAAQRRTNADIQAIRAAHVQVAPRHEPGRRDQPRGADEPATDPARLEQLGEVGGERGVRLLRAHALRPPTVRTIWAQRNRPARSAATRLSTHRAASAGVMAPALAARSALSRSFSTSSS